MPGASPLDQFRPERKRAALNRFCIVYAALSAIEKFALRVARHAKAQQIRGSIYVSAFKIARGHSDMESQTSHVVLREVHKALLLAAL